MLVQSVRWELQKHPAGLSLLNIQCSGPGEPLGVVTNEQSDTRYRYNQTFIERFDRLIYVLNIFWPAACKGFIVAILPATIRATRRQTKSNGLTDASLAEGMG